MANRGGYSVAAPGLPEFIRRMKLSPDAVQRAEFEWERASASALVKRAKVLAHAEGSTAAKAEADIALRGTSVVFGGRPYDMGAEFGAIVYKQFASWHGNDDEAGYFFWPAVREFQNDKLMSMWDDTVWQAFQDAFE